MEEQSPSLEGTLHTARRSVKAPAVEPADFTSLTMKQQEAKWNPGAVGEHTSRLESESEGEEVTVVSATDGATTEVAKLEQEVISTLKDHTELVREMSKSVEAGTVKAVAAGEERAVVEGDGHPVKSDPALIQDPPPVVVDTKVPETKPSNGLEDYSDPRSKPSKSHVNKVISRCSSIDSLPAQPRSPFQSNPHPCRPRLRQVAPHGGSRGEVQL